MADPIGNARIQNHADEVVGMRRAQHKRSLRLKLPAAGKDDDVFQETQRARFAAVLIVYLAVDVTGICQLNESRAGLEIAMLPPLQNQSRARSFPNQSRKNIESFPALLRDRRNH